MQDVLRAKLNREIIHGTQNARNIAKNIKRAIIESEAGADAIAKHFKGKTKFISCFNVYNYLRSHIKYEREGEQEQSAKTIQRILHDKKGDCKHYTIFATAILRSLGIPVQMRMISQNFYNPEPTHIYCVATINGEEIIIDPCIKRFNSEAQYKYKYNLKVN
jgi:hypothetical protein